MNTENSTPNKTITGTDDNDSIKNSGAVTKIYVQGGNDTVDNSANLVTISGGAGNDSVYNTGSNVVVSLDAGDDYVDMPSGTDIKIYGGAGKDSVYNHADKVSIYGGNDNDSVYNSGGDNVFISGDKGNDKLLNYYGQSSTISGGAGNDYIYYDHGYSYNGATFPNSISGGEGNDNICLVYTYNSTITGDKGDDTISFGSRNNNIIQYVYGDGNDTIIGLGSKDTLQITTPKSFESMTGGKDLYFIFDNGSITLKDVKAANVVTISGGSVDDEITTTTTTPTVEPTISGGDTVTTPIEETTTTSGGNGGDTIINYYGDYYDMSGNNGTIVNQSSVEGGVTNNTNIDNSTIIIREGDTYTYNGGNKTIENYQVGEVVALTSDYQGIGLNGNSFYVNSSSGSLEIQNARDKFIGYSAGDENVLVYSYLGGSGGAIDGRDKSQIELMIGADNSDNQIYAGNGGSSMWGGNGGNDVLTGGEGYDEFFYAIGSGNDTAKNVDSNDVINLLGISLDQIVGIDVNVGEVNINFSDGGNLKVEGNSGIGYKLGNTIYAVNQYTKKWSEK